MEDNGLNVLPQYKQMTVDEIREEHQRQSKPFAVAVINVTGDLNVATIIRNATLTGASKVMIFGRPRFPRRGLVGCNNYITLEKIPCLDETNSDIEPEVFVQTLKENKMFPVFVEQGGINVGDFQWKDVVTNENGLMPCFVFGNETNGISQEILNTSAMFEQSVIVSLKQNGVIRSYNVSSTSCAVLYHMVSSMGWF